MQNNTEEKISFMSLPLSMKMYAVAFLAMVVVVAIMDSLGFIVELKGNTISFPTGTVGVADVKCENFEMEIAAIAQITANFKWIRSGCICMAIANRKLNTFAAPEKSSIDPTLKTAADALEILDKMPL